MARRTQRDDTHDITLLLAENQSLHAENQSLHAENDSMRQMIDTFQMQLEEMKADIDALCASPNQSVAITGVDRNGSRKVEVCRHGGARDWVSALPAIPDDQLKIGASGRLAKEGNCLLEANGGTPHWTDVGIFERYLEKNRLLMTQDGRTLSVVPAEALAQVELHKGDQIGFNEATGIAYVRLKAPMHEDLFSEDVTPDDFSRLGGLDRQIAQIKETISCTILHPESASRYGLGDKHGILLCGRPGNGKTRIARCSASYLKELMPGTPCRFMDVVASQDYSMWLGKTEENLRARFRAAEQAAKEGPVVLFFDEFDALARRRGADHGSGAPDRILNTLLGLMDGVTRRSLPILLLAATNREDTLDPAVLRPGRFDEKIFIPTPNRAAAAAILRGYLGRVPLDPQHSLEELTQPILSQVYSPNSRFARLVQVKLADGRVLPIPPQQFISGATLENVVRVAAKAAFRREVHGGPDGICHEDLAVALADELQTTARLLTKDNVKSYVSSIPEDAQPVSVICNPSE